MSHGIAMHRIAERLFDTPLMLDAGKAEIVARGIARRVLGADVTVNNLIAVDGGSRPSMGVLRGQSEFEPDRLAHTEMTLHDGIALIEVEGTLVHKGGWLDRSSGVTSYEEIMAEVASAAAAGARGAVFEVDSFGGEAAGAFDAAEAIHELGQVMPTMAILTDHACSAGYLLASACHDIVMPATGIAGSIGVVRMHADYSGLLAKEGVTVTLLHAGAHKVDGNHYEPLPDAVRARIEGELASCHALFADTVGRYRGARLTAAQAMATQAQTYLGPEALALGLVDAVARPRIAFQAFSDQVNRG